MNPNITKIIDQYLRGELSPEEAQIFEDRLSKSPELQAELALQQQVYEGIKRSSQRVDVKKTARKYHLNRLLKWGGIGLSVLTVAAVTTYFIVSQSKSASDSRPELTEEIIAQLDKQAQIERLKTQYFAIPKEGDVQLSAEGVLISVPEKAFLLNGKPYSGPSIVQYQEALNASDIIRSGLSTTSGDRLLETQGMFAVQGFTPDGKPLEFNPEVGVYVQQPVEELKRDMQLFNGVKQADGTIDWQNPEPLEKIPVPVDMADLNFYPKGYEDKLDALKWKKNKEQRDSLYLSMEFFGSEEKLLEGEVLFENNCATCHHPSQDGTGPALSGVRQKWQREGALSGSIYQYVNDWQIAAQIDPYVREVINITPTTKDKFPNLDWYEIDKIFDYVDNETMDSFNPCNSGDFPSNEGEEISVATPPVPSRKISVEERNYLYGDNRPIDQNMTAEEAARLSLWTEGPNWGEFSQWMQDTIWADDAAVESAIPFNPCFERISPSKVMAFWNKKFNNTNLSTHEFERRMQAIHRTCNDDVLAKYVSGITRPIHEIDKEVHRMGYKEFAKFEAEHVGALNPNNPHVKGLQEFYKKGIGALKGRHKRYQELEKAKRQKWDREISDARTEEMDRTTNRETEVLVEEFEFNLDHVYKQLGTTNGFTLNHGGGTIKNVDAYVWEATVARETTEITDPFTGKKAKIAYNDFNFSVENPKKYIQLYAYLFPHELKSYHRLDPKNGQFDFPLNDEIQYDLGVVGITENGYEYFQKRNFNQGNLGTLTLDPLTEVDLSASIEQLNRMRISNPMPIREELSWLFRERKNYKERKRRMADRAFREEIAQILFPCYSPVESYNSQLAEEVHYLQ